MTIIGEFVCDHRCLRLAKLVLNIKMRRRLLVVQQQRGLLRKRLLVLGRRWNG